MRRWRCAALVMLLVAGCSRVRVPHGGVVLLVPMGSVPADVLDHLRRELPPLIDERVRIGAAVPLPASAFDATRKQYRGSAMLAELERLDATGVDRVVGVIDRDAYAPGLNFIFGQARPGGAAVVALPRLRDSFRGQPENEARFHERALKIAVHELGHSFGYQHCDDRSCVMHFSNSFAEVDQSGKRYCPRERP